MNFNTTEAKGIYISFLDYLIMTGDPLYRRLCSFAKKINGIKDTEDKKKLIAYFEKETGNVIGYFKNPNA